MQLVSDCSSTNVPAEFRLQAQSPAEECATAMFRLRKSNWSILSPSPSRLRCLQLPHSLLDGRSCNWRHLATRSATAAAPAANVLSHSRWQLKRPMLLSVDAHHMGPCAALSRRLCDALQLPSDWCQRRVRAAIGGHPRVRTLHLCSAAREEQRSDRRESRERADSRWPQRERAATRQRRDPTVLTEN